MGGEVPIYVEDNRGMGIVYGEEATTQGSQQPKKRGRPKKHKDNEDIEPPTAVNNKNLRT